VHDNPNKITISTATRHPIAIFFPTEFLAGGIVPGDCHWLWGGVWAWDGPPPKAVPQLAQKRALSGFAKPQFGQFMLCPL
jgi:hypothetical protein